MLEQEHIELLLKLASINTVSPMETGQPSYLAQANAVYAEAAVAAGMQVLYQGPGVLSDVAPLSVLRRRDTMGEDFLNNQPCLVLGSGNWQDTPRTMMFNFHMDTVGPHLPVHFSNGTFYGRGVADNKGPGVAVLAAIAAWKRRYANNTRAPGLLIQCVGGEEGGAMGVYSTRWLMQQGYYGSLNLFVIPSEMKYFDESTTSMTAELQFNGQGSTDDAPSAGDNATLVLAALIQSIARYLAKPLEEISVKMTVAGMHTGDMHNRVYGQGRALFNFSYRSQATGRQTEALFTQALDLAKQQFIAEFSGFPLFKRSADTLEKTLQSIWLKKDLPVLNNRNAKWENVLTQTDIMRHSDSTSTFTCDAMWGQRSDCYTIMFGPGSLAHNGAHTEHEHLSLTVLNEFSAAIFRLLNVAASTY